MGKVSAEDKMRIQTLHEQGLGARSIRAAYPDKNWKLSTIISICQRVRERGSALGRKAGSGRPRSARNQANIDRIAEMICSQEDAPGTSKSTREIAREVGISQASVMNIAKKDLSLSCYKRTPVQVITEATRLKRLARCRALLRRLPVRKVKQVFFTDEKIFYLSPHVCSQNRKVWTEGSKRNVEPERLLVPRAKFSAHVMVSAGVCYGGRGRLHFVADNVKVTAGYYTNELLPMLIADCNSATNGEFIFQQDGAPSHTARVAQEYLTTNCPDFIGKDQWPPNSPDLNPLDYHVWGVMLAEYDKYQPKPRTKDELKAVLQLIWERLPQEQINKAVLAFKKRLQACVKAEGGHFEHTLG